MVYVSTIHATRSGWLFLLGLLLASLNTHAQAPVWSGAAVGTTSQVNGASQARAVATDARGNVFVAGSFEGTVTFGSIVLTSAGSGDLFVAKYTPTTGTWAWAQRAGGTLTDIGYGIAVSGNSVYVTGFISNTTTNGQAVGFGGTSPSTSPTQVNGASTTASFDLVLAKYQDNGTTASLVWTQVGGGSGEEYGQGVAVSGTSIYVTGSINNDASNSRNVVFGGGGTTAGTRQVNGIGAVPSADLLLAKYTDNGSSATLGWTQVGGGSDDDRGCGVAATGTSVYLTGYTYNNLSNINTVVFGGGGMTAGTSPQVGASATTGYDLILAKYTDNGSSATFGWSQIGGGTASDQGYGVAVSGTSVYVTGYISNTLSNAKAVLFGGSGTVAGTTTVNGVSGAANADLVLVKYTDNGSSATLGWTQVGGGSSNDLGQDVAVSGSNVYVAGIIYNNISNTSVVVFGSNGTTVGTSSQAGAGVIASYDLLLAKYTDNGSTATFGWSQVGGGDSSDSGDGVAVSGQQVYAAGFVSPAASFGAIMLAGPFGSAFTVLARLTDPTLTPLPTRLVNAAPGLSLYPSPTASFTTLTGATPGAAVQVLDALSRVIVTSMADAAGIVTLRLPAGLAPGVYVVRAGTSAVRLVVE